MFLLLIPAKDSVPLVYISDTVFTKNSRPMKRLWDFNIEVTKTTPKAVYMQIADAIIAAIKNRRLKPQEILPSTRQLAQIIGVNRNTLIKALDILIIEGWLVSKDRVGIFVADISMDLEAPKQAPLVVPSNHTKPIITLDDGVPNTKIAPIKELASAYRRVFSLKSKHTLLGYTDSQGNPKLRALVVQMLNHKRGMQVKLEETCITRGSQMALYLLAQCLLTPNDYVLVEHPGYRPAWRTFEQAGAQVLPVNVDKEGVLIQEIEQILQRYSNIKAIYVTPHHQYPTTVTLSLKRRLQLIELAQKYHFKIIEDDYDHEFHFGNRPILPIASYTNTNHYIYIGTFSKIVAPALRIGYLVGHTDLIKEISSLREIIDIQNDTIMEQAIVELIKDGAIKRHTKRAIRYYKNKRQYVEKLLVKHLHNKVTYDLPTGGLAFWIRPIQDVDLSLLLAQLEQQGIRIADISKYNPDYTVNGLRLGYGSIENEYLEMAIIKLSKLLI